MYLINLDNHLNPTTASVSRYIIFNDGRCQGMQLGSDPFCSVVFDIQRLTRARVLPLPVYAVSPDGLSGLHVSFGRQEYAAPGKDLCDMPDSALAGSSKICTHVALGWVT